MIAITTPRLKSPIHGFVFDDAGGCNNLPQTVPLMFDKFISVNNAIRQITCAFNADSLRYKAFAVYKGQPV